MRKTVVRKVTLVEEFAFNGMKKKPYSTRLKSLTNEQEFRKIKLTHSRLLSGTFYTDPAIFAKEFMDVSFSVVSLILLSPFLLLIGIIIKLDSRGPILFKQERIGVNGKKFKMLKFRTMIQDAEIKKESLIKHNEFKGPAFKIKHDPRITKVGKVLRKTGIDEIPQFWNIIKGDMSVIGPRPPLEDEVQQYKSWHMKRLSVKPGVTCIWQTEPNRHDIDFNTWVCMDLEYINNWSLLKDAEIFFKTIKSVFMGSGH